MLTLMQCEIVQQCAQAVRTLLAELQSEEELFASANTLARVEVYLLVIAQTLDHLSPALHERLTQLDWLGWHALRDLLEQDAQPRREEVWYGVNALIPATAQLIDELRRREPLWFEIGY